jgi:hypothetical protein
MQSSIPSAYLSARVVVLPPPVQEANLSPVEDVLRMCCQLVSDCVQNVSNLNDNLKK